MPDKEMTIPQAVEELLNIVERLCRAYPHKRFTLDGRLVGDLGEVLVEQVYDITLHKGLEKHHDGTCSKGRSVQIKTTMKDSLTFPCDHVPDYYIGIKIHPNGSFDEIYNGPGSLVFELIKNRQKTKTNLHSLKIKALKDQQAKVSIDDQIPRRTGSTLG